MLAEHNTGPSVAPIRIDLTQSSSHTLFLAAGYQPVASQVTVAGNLTISVGSTWQGSGHDQFSAHMYYTPMAAGVGSLPITSPSSTGMSFAGSLDAGRGSLLSMSFGRAGMSLQASDPAMPTGAQQLNIGLHISPKPELATDVTYRQTDTYGAQQPATAETTATITATPNQMLQMQSKVDQVV